MFSITVPKTFVLHCSCFIHKHHPDGPLGLCAYFTMSIKNSVFVISMGVNKQVTVQVSVSLCDIAWSLTLPLWVQCIIGISIITQLIIEIYALPLAENGIIFRYNHLRYNHLGEYSPLLYGMANPSVLIGSFLIGILPYRPFPYGEYWPVLENIGPRSFL